MNWRITLSTVLALSLLAVPARECALGQSGAAQSGAQAGAPRLPVPSGPFGIGRVGYDWVDASRPDRYASDPHAHRELMVYLWYPTSQKAANVRGVYLPGAHEMDANPEIQRLQREEFEAAWPAIVSGEVFSHAIENAAPAKSPKRFPVVLLSHGLGGSGFEYTSQIEDLVSRGYIVAAIEHTEVARVVYFPDGRLVAQHRDAPQPGLSPDEQFKRMAASAGEIFAEGASDVRFVLDRLTEMNSADRRSFPLTGRLDLDRVAAMGHSAGAEFAARACQLDPRFKACVDLDGGMVPVQALPDFGDGATLKQPLLFLEAYYPESRMFGTHEQQEEYLRKKEAQLNTCARGSFAVTLHSPGLFHGSFSDYPLLVAGNSAAIDTALHNQLLVQSFVRAFLSKTLNGKPAPLLDDPGSHPSEADVRPIGH
jgi:dienelactone hydrolase